MRKILKGLGIVDVEPDSYPQHHNAVFRTWYEKIREFKDKEIADDWRYFSKAKAFIDKTYDPNLKLVFIGDCFDSPVLCQDNLIYAPASLHSLTKRISARNTYRWVVMGNAGLYRAFLNPRDTRRRYGKLTDDPFEAHLEGIGFVIDHLENIRDNTPEPEKIDRIIDAFEDAIAQRRPVLSNGTQAEPKPIDTLKEKTHRRDTQKLIDKVFGGGVSI